MIARLRAGATAAILTACTSAEPPVSVETPEPPPIVHVIDRIPEPPQPEPMDRMVAPEHRVHGNVAGGFFVAGGKYPRVGEPVVVTFEVHSTDGPMTVFVGGDQRNAAYFPTQVAVKVQRVEDGAIVCDSVTAPAIPSFGGPGSDRTMKEDEVLRESFVLNPMCPALAEPGSYRITLHRRILSMAHVLRPPEVDTPTSCMANPLHEDSPLTGYPTGCVEMLKDAPSVATSFELGVQPYERVPVESAISAAYARADASTPKDEVLKNRLDAWLKGWVKCDGKPLGDDAPKTLAGGCARPSVR